MKKYKRERGIYYTPKEIATYITKKALIYYLYNENNNKFPDSFEQLLNYLKEDLSTLEDSINSLKILDPACGTGIFLKSVVKLATKLKLKIRNLTREKDQNIKLRKANLEQETILNNIYGVDIDKNAIQKTQQYFLSKFISIEKVQSYFKNSFNLGNSIVKVNFKKIKGINWDKQFKNIMDRGGFDIIIGNPPWGADLKRIRKYLQKEYPIVARGQFDSYSIFLYMALRDLLKENGVLGFVLPNELCFLDQYQSLRKYLLNFEIRELINLGFNIFDDVQKPALLLLIKKSKKKPFKASNKANKVFISVGISEEEKKNILTKHINLQEIIRKNSYFRSQQEFNENRNYIFDIFSDPLDKEIIQIINSQNFPPLKHYFINGRGIDTNKKGKFFVCPECGFLNPPFGRGHSGRISQKECSAPNCNFMFQKEKKGQYEKMELISEGEFPKAGYTAPGYIGEDLYKLHFARAPRAVKYYGNKLTNPTDENLFKNYSGIQWGKHELYEGEKLLIRKVSSGHNLQVMVHNGFLVTNQQIYIFKKKASFNYLSIYYFLGIVASRLIYYFYIKQYGDPDKKILPHFTQAHIKALPIPLVSTENESYKNIVNVSKKLVLTISYYFKKNIHPKLENNKKFMEKIENLYAKLDKSVFSIYNIKNDAVRHEIIIRANKNGFSLF
jgi:hypothetical protein